MYNMYTNALSYTHVHTHVSSCVVWRVHPQARINGKQPMLTFLLFYFLFLLYQNNKVILTRSRTNHLVFEGASYLRCFSMKLSGSNNFPTYRHAKTHQPRGSLKVPKLDLHAPKRYNQIWDQTPMRLRIWGKTIWPLYIHGSLTLETQASYIQE